MIPLLPSTTLRPTRRAFPRDTGFSSPPQTFLASPAAKPANSRARWSNMRSPRSTPLGEVGASPRVPRLHSRPTRPPATRAHRLSAHRSSDEPARDPRPRPELKGGRERQPGLPPPSHSRPARRPPSPRLQAAVPSQPRALLYRRRSPHSHRRVRTTLPPVGGHLEARQEAPRRPSPTQSPSPRPPPERVSSTPPRPASGAPPVARGEVRPTKRGRGRQETACAPGTPSRGVPQSEGRRSAGPDGGGGQRQHSPVPQSPS